MKAFAPAALFVVLIGPALAQPADDGSSTDVSALILTLQSGGPEEREGAARALGESREVAEHLYRYADAVRGALNDPTDRVRERMIILLLRTNYGFGAIPEVRYALDGFRSEILAALRDPDPYVRWQAAQAVYLVLSDYPEEATAPLLRLLDDPLRKNRVVALRALAGSPPSARDQVTTAALDLSTSSEDGVLGHALTLLGSLYAGAERLDPRVENALRGGLLSNQRFVRQEAADAVGAIGPAAENLVEDLRRVAADSESPVVRSNAEAALKSVLPRDQ